MTLVEQYIKEHKEFMERKEKIYNKNEAIIKEWRSIPWYKFWKKTSFETQRDIIIRNWGLNDTYR